MAELTREMELGEFKFRRMAAALGIGLGSEALILFGAVIVANKVSPPWGEWIANLMQDPGVHFVQFLGKLEHPGFEEQVGYVLLIPVIQWLFYSAVIYLMLAWRRPLPSDTTPRRKEISNLP
jgi:hypothetical protein